MEAQSQCQCRIPEEMKAAGAAAALCHHSSLQEIAETNEKLKDLLVMFDRNIDPVALFKLPPDQAIEYYIRETIQDDPTLVTRQERAIYTAAFIRHYGIILDLMMLDALAEIRKGTFNA